MSAHIFTQYKLNGHMSTHYLLNGHMSTQYLLNRHLSERNYFSNTDLCNNHDLDMILHYPLRLHLSWDLFILYHYHDCENKKRETYLSATYFLMQAPKALVKSKMSKNSKHLLNCFYLKDGMERA